MPFKSIGREVTRGSICRDRWHATVTIACPDRLPVGQPAPLYVHVEWRKGGDDPDLPDQPDDAKPITLTLRKRADSSPGSISFEASGGPKTRGFSSNTVQLLTLFPETATSGDEPDVIMDVSIDGEVRDSIPLLVGSPSLALEVRAENGTDPPVECFLRGGSPQRFKAVVTPAADGTTRWLSPGGLTIRGDAAQSVVEVEAPRTSAAVGDLPLLAAFTPASGPTVVAVHRLTAAEAAVVFVRDPAHTPLLLGTGKTEDFSASISPQGLATGLTWSISQGGDKARIDGPTDQQVVHVATTAASGAVDDVQLTATFATTLQPRSLALTRSLTVTRVTVDRADGAPVPVFLNVGNTVRLRARVAPDPLPISSFWRSTPDPNSTSRATVQPDTTIALAREAIVSGIATSRPHDHDDLQLAVGLVASNGDPLEATVVVHRFTVPMEQPLQLFVPPDQLGGWSTDYTFGPQADVPLRREHAMLSTRAAARRVVTAGPGRLSARPPQSGGLGGTEDFVLPAEGATLPSVVTLYLHLSDTVAGDPSFAAASQRLGTLTGFAYLNLDTATLADSLAELLDGAPLPAGVGPLDRGQRLERLVRGELEVPIPAAGHSIGGPSSAGAAAGASRAGFGVLTRAAPRDPAETYDVLREFVLDGQPAVDQFLAKLPQGPAAVPVDPVDPAASIDQTANELLTMAALQPLKAALSPADWRTVGNNQKQLWLARLERRLGVAPADSAAAAFEFDDQDLLNVFQLEALVEMFVNYDDPWAPRSPARPRHNQRLRPGDADYIPVNLLTGFQLVLIDAFGGRISGARALAVNTLVRLDGPPNLGAVRADDWIRLDTDDARADRRYRITAKDETEGVVAVDAQPHLVGGHSGWQIELAAGGTLRGDAAAVRRDVIELDAPPAVIAQMGTINPAFDTVYLPSDRGARNRTYRIQKVLPAQHRLVLDDAVDLDGGVSSWHIPAGVSGVLPDLAFNFANHNYDKGPEGRHGFDQYDGAMFVVHNGEVFLDGGHPYRWSSYTSRHQENLPAAQVRDAMSSVRGNRQYSFSSALSPKAFINYAFTVIDPGAAYNGVRENRFYFDAQVDEDTARAPDAPAWPGPGKTDILIHNGTVAGGTGSGGCIVSPRFYAWRDLMIGRYQADRATNGQPPDAQVNQLVGQTQVGSEALRPTVPPTPPELPAAAWNGRITGSLWLIRPDERPLAPPTVTLYWPDSRRDHPEFKGTPVLLPDDRLPYLHPTLPTSFEQAITLRATAQAQQLRRGLKAGEYVLAPEATVPVGTDYFLVVPEHTFVSVAPSAWRKRVQWANVAAGAGRTYGVRVRLVAVPLPPGRNPDDYPPELRITPLGEAERNFDGDLYVIAIVPSLRDTLTADLTQPWQRAVRGLREAVGEYPTLDERRLPFHRPFSAAELPSVREQHRMPEEFIRLLPRAEDTYTSLSDHFTIEQLRWKEETLTGSPPAQRLRYLPLPKRELLQGIEALRARLGPNAELEGVTGFIPPNKIDDALALRTVRAERGYRANQIRHIFGDAVDLDRTDARLDSQLSRHQVADALLPWPDTQPARDLRAAFDVAQFQSVMLTSGPTRRYVLHLEHSGYHLPFEVGLYQVTLDDLTADGGDAAIAAHLGAAAAHLIDIVVTFAQSPKRPKAAYPSQLNSHPPHGHQVFDSIVDNPNLDTLLRTLANAGQVATLNLQLAQVGHNQDVEAVVPDLFRAYPDRPALRGVQLDLNTYDASADATAVIQGLADAFRPSQRLLCPVWHDTSVGRINWGALRALDDYVVPVFDGRPKQLWTGTARTEWLDKLLDGQLLQHAWHATRNLRVYGHNMVVPVNVPAAERGAALAWLGRTSRLYGSSLFVFQFENYGQAWAADAADLSGILEELG